MYGIFITAALWVGVTTAIQAIYCVKLTYTELFRIFLKPPNGEKNIFDFINCY